MRIAVISDSHDNIWNLREVLKIINRKSCGMIIHLGDFISPFMLKELEKAEIPVHGVFGNNDGDHFTATKMSLTTLTNITLHGIKGELTVDNRNIGFTHYPDIAEAFAFTGKYDVICFGHNHTHSIEKVEDTVILNPGEVMGKDGSPGFCIINTMDLSIDRIEIPKGQ